jgi:hypothetical protein
MGKHVAWSKLDLTWKVCGSLVVVQGCSRTHWCVDSDGEQPAPRSATTEADVSTVARLEGGAARSAGVGTHLK